MIDPEKLSLKYLSTLIQPIRTYQIFKVILWNSCVRRLSWDWNLHLAKKQEEESLCHFMTRW